MGASKSTPPNMNAQVSGKDPLYTVRDAMEHFQRNCYEIAAPRGVVAMDENAQPSSARTRGTSYNPNKPHPHAFRFYCVNTHAPNYLHTMFDNGAGNTNSLCSAQRYLTNFPTLNTAYHKYFTGKDTTTSDRIAPDGCNALWSMMLAQGVMNDSHSHSHETINNFTDSYYTRHVGARATKELSDGRILTTGKTSMNKYCW